MHEPASITLSRALLAVLTLATIACGSGPNGDVLVAPEPPRLQQIIVALNPQTIRAGAASQAVAAGIDQQSKPFPLSSITWQVADGAASVDTTGRVVATRAGSVVVRASANGMTGSAILTVLASAIQTVVVRGSRAPETGISTDYVAEALDAAGANVKEAEFTWSTASNGRVSAISRSGTLTGRNAFADTVIATETFSGRVARFPIEVVGPRRPAGALLGVVPESVAVIWGMMRLSTLVYVDTARTAPNWRVSWVHAADADVRDPGLRRDFPEIVDIAECPNGEAVALVENPEPYSSSAYGRELWRLDPRTGAVTFWREGPAIEAAWSVGCDDRNVVLLASTIGDYIGFLYRYSADGQTAQEFTLQYRVVGLARSPTGEVFATVSSSTASTRLVVLDPGSGQIVRTIGVTPWVRRLAFSGARLFGFVGNTIVEIDPATGVQAPYKTAALPP